MSDIYNPIGVLELVAGSNITLSPTGGTGVVTVSSSGGVGGGSVISVSTFPYTMLAASGLTIYNIYAGGAAVTINFPVTPAANQISRIVDAGNTSNTNPITINGNGNNISAYGNSTNSSIQINSNGGDIWLSWDGTNLA